MGSTISQPKNELSEALPYICGLADHELKVDPSVKLEVRDSTLASSFLEGRQLGLFAVNSIPKGTCILEVNLDEECKMNDGIVNLQPILRAQNSEEMYQAWMNLQKTYYDMEKIKKVINVRMVSNGSQQLCYETIQDIPAGGELLRVYGFSSWFFEILEIFNNKTMLGFAQFIDDFFKNMSGDPLGNKVRFFS